MSSPLYLAVRQPFPTGNWSSFIALWKPRKRREILPRRTREPLWYQRLTLVWNVFSQVKFERSTDRYKYSSVPSERTVCWAENSTEHTLKLILIFLGRSVFFSVSSLDHSRALLSLCWEFCLGSWQPLHTLGNTLYAASLQIPWTIPIAFLTAQKQRYDIDVYACRK